MIKFRGFFSINPMKVVLLPKIQTDMDKKKRVTFDVLIEIPKGSRNKYEYDFVLHKIRFDRTLFSSMMYPGDYGFVPETLALDKDPLDVLVAPNPPIPWSWWK